MGESGDDNADAFCAFIAALIFVTESIGRAWRRAIQLLIDSHPEKIFSHANALPSDFDKMKSLSSTRRYLSNLLQTKNLTHSNEERSIEF